MTAKRTITTTSCQFQLRLPWALREEIEALLEDGESLGGWIKDACELRLSGIKPKKNKPQERTVQNAANERRVAETKDKIELVIAKMDSEEKTQLLAERYPKARFSELSSLSKDTVRRYWDEIEQLLNES